MHGASMASSSVSTLKRKHAPSHFNEPPPKKSKHSSPYVQEFTTATKKKKDRDSSFKTIKAKMMVTIPPLYTSPGRPKEAVEEMLDSMLMKYIPALQGVLLSHSNVEFLDKTATFLVDSPFAKVDISFDAMIWCPEVGSKLTGTLSICSPDHISLLIHKTFNASIPRHHIPSSVYEFQYTQPPLHQERNVEEDLGKWIDKSTGEEVGEKGKVRFIVIGLSLSHGMLSLIGSLQPDPFSSEHVPQPAISPSKPYDDPHRAIEGEASDEDFVEEGRQSTPETSEALGKADALHEVERKKRKKKRKEEEGGRKKKRKDKE